MKKETSNFARICRKNGGFFKCCEIGYIPLSRLKGGGQRGILHSLPTAFTYNAIHYHLQCIGIYIALLIPCHLKCFVISNTLLFKMHLNLKCLVICNTMPFATPYHLQNLVICITLAFARPWHLPDLVICNAFSFALHLYLQSFLLAMFFYLQSIVICNVL